MNKRIIKQLITQALIEDLGIQGDITTDSIFSKTDNAVVEAEFLMKSPGILSGLDIVEMVFNDIDHSIEILKLYNDGDFVKKGKIILKLKGKASSLLIGERLALNFLQRMSGIATKTNKLVKKIEAYGVKLVDTRKTTPNFRVFEKLAVKAGGGFNHRFGLYDMVMIKDNHIKAAGGIKEAVARVRANNSHSIKIEIEVQDIDQLKSAVDSKVDIIMLDNFSPSEVKPLLKLIPDGIIVECSGNIDEKNIIDYAKVGPDIISMGSLTHSYSSLDISMAIITE
ncbi:carboxylating nicotinate-nucleotide diphosphorylase [Candidatus Dependentiae bacterium]|nr:carboxylating nicotinate-nucleotide diphosphorylase [Candidatus Dependentiae bacterium]